MSEDFDWLADAVMRDTRDAALATAIHHAHRAQQKTILAVVMLIRQQPTDALNNAEAALDALLQSQDELERVSENLQVSGERIRAAHEARND